MYYVVKRLNSYLNLTLLLTTSTGFCIVLYCHHKIHDDTSSFSMAKLYRLQLDIFLSIFFMY